MGNNMQKARGREFFAMLASILLAACLPGCENLHLSGESIDGGLMKKTTNVIAVAAIEIASPFKVGTVRSAWQDGSGMWHWTRVEQGVGTFQCEGPELGTPKQCEKVSPQW